VPQWAIKVTPFKGIKAPRTTLYLSDLSLRRYFAHMGQRFALWAFLITAEN
jgi:hypothetical protein